MNILFINSISRRKFGGGEKWMVKAARGLTEAGHRVFLASKRNAVILDAANRAGIKIRVFNVRADFSPINTIRIARFLRREAIDVLICNLNKDVRVAGLAARFVKTPAVIARHGVLLCAKKWKHKVTLQNFADGILTNTNSIREKYATYHWFDDDFVKVIYNGIEDKNHVQAYDFSDQFPGRKIVFSAGRLSPQKGFEYLIHAAVKLKNRRDDLVFVVAGRGGLENQLKRQLQQTHLQDSFHFLGYIENIDPYLKGCDLFVLSSLFEGMPNVVMEAMAVGKAVVATDVNGVGELMVDGETGIIVPPRNSDALAEAIERCVDNPRLLRKYGQKGLERVRAHFTLAQMIRNLEAYFLEKVQS